MTCKRCKLSFAIHNFDAEGNVLECLTDADGNDLEIVAIEDVNSTEIRSVAKDVGVTHATLLEEHGEGDRRIVVYLICGAGVTTTNGDPVWEDDDPEAFATFLATCRSRLLR